MEFLTELLDGNIKESLFMIFLVILGFCVVKVKDNFDTIALYPINLTLKLLGKKQLDEKYFDNLLFDLKLGIKRVNETFGEEVFQELKTLVQESYDKADDIVIREYNEKYNKQYKTLKEVLADVLDRNTNFTYEQCLRIIDTIYYNLF